MLVFDALIHQLLVQPIGVGEAMSRLIDAHEQKRLGGDWRPYRGLAFDAEADRLARRWFPAVVADEPPVRVPVRGLFFGLFEPVVRRFVWSQVVADCYLGGATRFELDADWDWAVRPAYVPRKRYARSPVLARIHRLAYRRPGGLRNDAEASLCLGFAALAARAILSVADPALLVAPGASVGVAVGWDSGSPLYVGRLTQDGFVARDVADAMAGLDRRRERFQATLRRLRADRA